mgnify:CR=1 FL=1
MSLGSFSILAWLAGGAVLGALLFPPKWLRAVDGAITAGVALVLFCMGVSLGGDPAFLENLLSAGGPAALMALCTVGGSVLAVWALCRLFLKGGRRP